MRDRQNCIECGKQSPETETNYTLISAQFGWRLTRRKTDSGDFVVEWRCPECWRKHKAKMGDEPPSGLERPSVPERPRGRSSRPPPASAAVSRASKPPSIAPPLAPLAAPRKRS